MRERPSGHTSTGLNLTLEMTFMAYCHFIRNTTVTLGLDLKFQHFRDQSYLLTLICCYRHPKTLRHDVPRRSASVTGSISRANCRTTFQLLRET